MNSLAPLLPRFVRFRDAPGYLGMDRNRFNTVVRPELTEIPIGTQGIAFDRLELEKMISFLATNRIIRKGINIIGFLTMWR